MSKSCLLYENFSFDMHKKIDAKDVDNIDIIKNIKYTRLGVILYFLSRYVLIAYPFSNNQTNF